MENQSILRITSGLCLNKDNQSTIAIRIMEVSKNHQNQVCTAFSDSLVGLVLPTADANINDLFVLQQRFRLQIALPQCQLTGSTPAPAVTESVLVLSKKVSASLTCCSKMVVSVSLN